ncbi:MAG: hypothetical protein SAJ12_12790 [Jaaginema sp. PMC 1079.18]|nr:hypothetical protein [Jaaginema sp. PMC 1080.18]MEC4851882.1 hypothetical protein [Jaaginema sp. PMC 1079.18]MEC4865360.1 hypothetical protein [Jaaginema sp. PMC 1078.18]
MKVWWQIGGGLVGAIALQFLGQPLPSEAASLWASFSTELDGSLLTGTLTGNDQSNDGQINAWDLSAFSATWRDYTWDLSGLGGFRMYYQPNSDVGTIDWIFAQQYQSTSGQIQTLSHTPLQVGVFEFKVSDLSGVNHLAYLWRWGNGITAAVGDPPETPIIPPDEGSNPSTSVPEPGLWLGLGAIALWGLKQRQPST